MPDGSTLLRMLSVSSYPVHVTFLAVRFSKPGCPVSLGPPLVQSVFVACLFKAGLVAGLAATLPEGLARGMAAQLDWVLATV